MDSKLRAEVEDRLAWALEGEQLVVKRWKERDPGLHDAIVNGLQWRKAVAQNFPQLLRLTQQCGNASLVKGEGELQILRRLHSLFTQEKNEGLMPDYQRIKKRALASWPACAKSTPHLYQFMLKFAGGHDGSFLVETEQFCRAHGSSTKSMGPALWEVLAADVRGRTEKHVWVRHAFIKLAWVKDIGTVSDIKRCLRSKEFAKRLEIANHIVSETKGIVDHLGLPWAVDGKVAAALGFTHIAMAAFLLNAKIPGEASHDSLEGIAHDFAQIIKGITQNEFAPPWEAYAQKRDTDSSRPPAGGDRLRELDRGGTVKNPQDCMADAGFPVGSFVKRKATQERGQISGVTQDLVRVKQPDGNTFKVSIKAFLSGEWARFTPKAEPTVVDDLSLFKPSDFSDWKVLNEKARIVLELEHLHMKHEADACDSSRVVVKPNRACFVTKPLKKLTLVPTTMNIKYDTEPSPDRYVIQSEDMAFTLNPTVIFPKEDDESGFVTAFWFVETTSKVEEATMQVTMVKVGNPKIQIPILTNVGQLNKGDRLAIYKKKVTKEAEPLEVSPAKKRRREKGPE
ncbi:unnamed protein product [Durusdinium trenchii]|uniref:Uncharacterized protein n=1 Tax=Durusdinium trenchii TaxID=1381693 RepID=A0ABP0RSF3_9DINO